MNHNKQTTDKTRDWEKILDERFLTIKDTDGFEMIDASKKQTHSYLKV